MNPTPPEDTQALLANLDMKAELLARAVTDWASTPCNHGGNPYLLEHVILARKILSGSRRPISTEFIVDSLSDALRKLAIAAARIVDDQTSPTLEHMSELNRCRRKASQILKKFDL